MPGLLSLSRALNPGLGMRLSEVILLGLDQTDAPDQKNVTKLQYYPESISDTKAINWQQKEIPGGSLPLYQWVSSGARTIGFTAQFSCDIDLDTAAPDPSLKLKAFGEETRNVDIRSACLKLRQFLLPKYGGTVEIGVPLTYAPAKLKLFMPGTGIGLFGGGPALGGKDSILCVMTQCDITFEQFFMNGIPRLASVQLAFDQIPQFGGAVYFPSVEDEMKSNASGGKVGQFYGYNLTPNERSSKVVSETSANLTTLAG